MERLSQNWKNYDMTDHYTEANIPSWKKIEKESQFLNMDEKMYLKE